MTGRRRASRPAPRSLRQGPCHTAHLPEAAQASAKGLVCGVPDDLEAVDALPRGQRVVADEHELPEPVYVFSFDAHDRGSSSSLLGIFSSSSREGGPMSPGSPSSPSVTPSVG